MTNLDHKAILADALKLPAGQRAAYLDRVCAGKAALRARIERLLKAVEESGAFPPEEKGEAARADTTFHTPAGLEGAGAKIGPYKLLQQIGEGGFGYVFMAEQHEPVRRKVALKIVKPGMDTREVIARFEAERQALALMDHPNIARVLDAGATASGRPFFVMELVRGVSLTEYCDKNQLPTRGRLELFATICQAVQHAHQKGIIHRDLKPSNILVTLHDGKPVPKVIDFGVAKALNQQLTEKTLFTAYGQMVGTPQYMSPEQAEMSGLDVDTRSDIYSLGVLLYELLTGTTPVDSQRLHSAGFAEMQRIIREEEPPRPSTRISTLGAEATTVAQHRKADPRRLRQELEGELDWIVMKALEKDRNRRYASASNLVDDVQRFLRDEAVLACPPSAAYRFQKFARRNKALLATLGAIALVLLAGAAISTVMVVRAVRAERLAQQRLTSEIAARTDAEQAQAAEATQRQLAEGERDRAETARRQATLELGHAVAAERQAEANFDQARGTVDQYLTTVSESQLLTIPGMQPLRQAMLDAALEFYERFVAQRPQDPQLRAGLAAAYARLGRVQSDMQRRDEGREYYSKAQRLYEELFQEGQATPEMERGLAEVYFWRGEYTQTVLICQHRLRENPEDRAAQQLLANTYNTLAVNERNDTNPPEALRLHRDAFRLRTALVTAEPTNAEYLGDMGSTVNNVGVLLARRNKAREALAQFQLGVDFAERAFAAARYSVLYGRFLAIGRRNESGWLAQLGLADEAVAARRRVADIWQRLASDNPALPGLRAEVSKAYRDLANLQRRLGRNDEAAQTILQSRQLIENLPQETADDVYNLALVYATLAKDAPPGASAAAAGPAAEDLRTALRTLARAAAIGYRNRAAVDKEPAFAVLKQRQEFQTLTSLLELRERIDATAKDNTKLSEMRALRDELEPLRDEPLAALLVAETLGTIADYLMRAGDAEAARADCQRALELLRRAAANPRATADTAAAVETARSWQLLGQLHFRAQRYADAMSAWQSARATLDAARQGRQDDARLTEAVAALEYELAEAHGTLGAFDGAREHYELGFAAAPLKDSLVAFQHATVLAELDDKADYRRVVTWMQTNFGETEWYHDARIAIAECLVPAPTTSGRNLVTPAAKAVQAAPQDPWAQMSLALAYLRSDAPAIALDTLSQYEPSHWIAGPYYQALAFHALGDEARAREQFDWAETQYHRVLAKNILVDTDPALFSSVQGTRSGGTRAWSDVLVAQLARAEASATIEGQPRSDPWKHLLAARGFGLLGDTERASAAFARAEQAAEDDPEVWIVCGRVRARLGDYAAADQSFQRAIDLAPQNASPWIARGRYFAERGAADKAESDFAHAASLTPNELHQFLEGGWWVLGPVPEQLTLTAAAVVAGDPARPLTIPGTSAARPATSLTWQPRQPDALGGVSFGPEMRKPNRRALAMTVVYSPDERPTTLWTGGHDQLRVWLNGQLVHEITVPVTWLHGLDCVPVVLRRGRNVVLVEATHEAGPENLYVRLGDSPLERAFGLARLGLWQESLPYWREYRKRHSQDPQYALICSSLMSLLVGDVDGYDHCSQELFRWSEGRLRNGLSVLAIRSLNLRADDARDHGRMIQLAESTCAKKPVEQWWSRAPLGMVYHRAGNFAEQVEWLKPHEKHYFLQIWLALGHHGLGQQDEAKRLLQQADESFLGQTRQAESGPSYRYVHGGAGWFEPNEFIIYRREAARLIEGQTDEFDKLVADYVEQGRRELARRTPELAAYDEAVAYHHNLPRAWRARARRLIELARWDEAARDLDHALSLKNDDPSTWIAYAEYWLDRGDAQQAADSALQAIKNVAADPSEWTGQELAALFDRINDTLLDAVEPATRAGLLAARARRAADAGKSAEAKQDFQQALEADSQNASLWIARGRFHAEWGDHEQADADFAKAASLTPDELNKYLEDGWWVVGPYPAQLKAFCPPEVDPDPSQPVRVIDPQTGLSDQPARWVSVPTGTNGVVDLSEVPGRRDGSSVYALAYVCAPTDQTVMLLIKKNQALRIWVNGELIEHRVPGDYPMHPHYEPFHRLAVSLHRGRNTILVKSALPTFEVRIGDSPRDRALLLAEQERFAEAAEVLGRLELTASDFRAARFPFWMGSVLAMETNLAYSYERVSMEFAQLQNPDLHHKFVIPFICSQRPTAMFDEHAEQLVSFADEYAMATPANWTFFNAALANYRAGNYDRARSLLEQSAWLPNALPLQALLEHQAGDTTAAVESLTQALAAGAEYEQQLRTSDRSDFRALPTFRWWYDWAWYLNLLIEAEQTIRGETTASTNLKRQAEETMARRWSESPETAAFDRAVLFTAIGKGGELKFPGPLVARGKRLAELGRWDEAAADFDKGVELAPDDWQILLARASFLAQRREISAAADEFKSLLGKTAGDKFWLEGRVVEREIARNEPLLKELQSRHPQAAIYWRLRGERHARLGHWDEAAEALATGDPFWSHYSLLAILHCLRGDVAAYEHACEEEDRLSQEQLQSDTYASVNRCNILTMHVGDSQQAQELLKLALQQQREHPADRNARLNLGLAYYRNGHYKAAWRWIEESLTIPSSWQDHVVAWPAMAMCHWQLGNQDEARRWLQKSAWWVDFTRRAVSRPESVGPHSIDILAWLRAHALYQEAENVLGGGETE